MFQEIAFWALSAAGVGGALGVVLVRDVFRAALLLVLVFMTVAGLFVLMSAEFLAVVQLLIYVGAVAILIVFAIMLTREVQQGNLPNRLHLPAGILTALLLAAFVYVVLDTDWNQQVGLADIQPGQEQLVQERLEARGLGWVSEAVQSNTVGGLPVDWEDGVERQILERIGEVPSILEGRSSDQPTREVTALETEAQLLQAELILLEQGRLVARLHPAFAEEFQAATGPTPPSEDLMNALNAPDSPVQDVVEIHPKAQGNITWWVGPDGELQGQDRWWLVGPDGDLKYSVVPGQASGTLSVNGQSVTVENFPVLNIFEGRYEQAEERTGIGDLLINDYMLAFEVAAVLLLATIIGALVITRER